MDLAQYERVIGTVEINSSARLVSKVDAQFGLLDGEVDQLLHVFGRFVMNEFLRIFEADFNDEGRISDHTRPVAYLPLRAVDMKLIRVHRDQDEDVVGRDGGGGRGRNV